MTQIAASRISLRESHVQLPFEMFGGDGGLLELFEGGSVFFVLDLLRFVAGIEVVLKLTSEVDLFKRIALRFVRNALFAAAFFVFTTGQRFAGSPSVVAGKLAKTSGSPEPFVAGLPSSGVASNVSESASRDDPAPSPRSPGPLHCLALLREPGSPATVAE